MLINMMSCIPASPTVVTSVPGKKSTPKPHFFEKPSFFLQKILKRFEEKPRETVIFNDPALKWKIEKITSKIPPASTKKKKSQRRLFLFYFSLLTFRSSLFSPFPFATFSGEERREKREKKRWFCSAKHLSASSNPSAETHIHLFRTPLTKRKSRKGGFFFL